MRIYEKWSQIDSFKANPNIENVNEEANLTFSPWPSSQLASFYSPQQKQQSAPSQEEFDHPYDI